MSNRTIAAAFLAGHKDQYPKGTPQGDRPDEVIDPQGDRWAWVAADKRGIPGYQWAGDNPGVGRGPAYTRDYVQQGRICAYYGPACPKHDHSVPAVEADHVSDWQETR